jgi:hypothetical protein
MFKAKNLEINNEHILSWVFYKLTLLYFTLLYTL